MEVMRTALSSLFSRSRKRKREEMEDDVEEGTLPSAPLLDSDAAASTLTPPALPPPPPPPPASAGRDHETKRVLLEQLSCPVCLCSPLLPPARQCPNGHLLCDACSKQPACAKCPTCRSSPTNIRCLALEKVAGAEGITAPCPHCEAEVVSAAPTPQLHAPSPPKSPGHLAQQPLPCVRPVCAADDDALTGVRIVSRV